MTNFNRVSLAEYEPKTINGHKNIDSKFRDIKVTVDLYCK